MPHNFSHFYNNHSDSWLRPREVVWSDFVSSNAKGRLFMKQVVETNLKEALVCLQRVLEDDLLLEAIAGAGELLSDGLAQGGKIYSCGNGGSMCDAMHFAEELTGRFRLNRKPLPALAISDGSYLSCAANDFGYEHVFSRFVEGFGKPGDMLLAISTSGKSENVILAAKMAKSLDMKIVSLTGKPGSQLGELADIDICTQGTRFADRVQELHIKVIHTLIELIERHRFGENYGES